MNSTKNIRGKSSKLNGKSNSSITLHSKPNKGPALSISEPVPYQNSHSKSIEENILLRSQNSKSALAEHRQKTKALQLQELKQAPHLESSIKRIKSLENLPTAPDSSKKEKKTKKKDLKTKEKDANSKSPQKKSLIDPPDLSKLKEIISKFPQKNVVNNVKLTDLNIVQKTELLSQKKQEKVEKAKLLQIQTDLQACTFKPDLQKPSSTKAVIQNIVTPKVNNFANTPRSCVEPEIRIPVPAKHVHISNTDAKSQQIFLSTHYSQFSPISKIYGFKEGANIEELKNRSQHMMTYYVHTNRT